MSKVVTEQPVSEANAVAFEDLQNAEEFIEEDQKKRRADEHCCCCYAEESSTWSFCNVFLDIFECIGDCTEGCFGSCANCIGQCCEGETSNNRRNRGCCSGDGDDTGCCSGDGDDTGCCGGDGADIGGAHDTYCFFCDCDCSD